MKLSSIYLEATTEFVGPLRNSLGDGSDWSINYGTGDSRSPFLYIKVPLQFVNSAIRKVRKNYLIYAEYGTSGTIEQVSSAEEGKARAKQLLRANPNLELYLFPKITHVGESHLTIAMGRDLHEALLVLQERFGVNDPVSALRDLKINGRPLFDRRGSGLKADIDITTDPFTVYRAGYYSDEADPAGPMVVALKVKADLYPLVREALGLPREAIVPGTENDKGGPKKWSQHITLGYIAKKNMIHQSYLDRMAEPAIS